MADNGNQLNLTVVALVALVAIVGLVALVMNAASLKTFGVATGSKTVEAQDIPAVNTQNVGGQAVKVQIPDMPPSGIGGGQDTPENRRACGNYARALQARWDYCNTLTGSRKDACFVNQGVAEDSYDRSGCISICGYWSQAVSNC